jgi:hypothetical protein
MKWPGHDLPDAALLQLLSEDAFAPPADVLAAVIQLAAQLGIIAAFAFQESGAFGRRFDLGRAKNIIVSVVADQRSWVVSGLLACRACKRTASIPRAIAPFP